MTAAQSPGVTQDQLETLIYGDNIPGFQLAGTRSQLDVGNAESVGGVRSYIERDWTALDGLNALRIRCTVYSDPVNAHNAFEEHVLSSSGLTFTQTPRGNQYGDEFRCNGVRMTLAFFRVSRVIVRVNVIPHGRGLHGAIAPLDATVDAFVEGLASGLEWAIRGRPELLARGDTTQRRPLYAGNRPLPTDPALTFHRVTWTPLSAFEAAGAQVRWDAKTSRATIRWQGRTAQLRPFHRQAEVGGKQVDLGAPVLLGRSGPVVPLYRVAKALGMRVETTSRRITLHPPPTGS